MTTRFLVHIDDVGPFRIDRGPLQGERRRLGAAAGATKAGLSHYALAAGERAMPVHVHGDEEEIFYVLRGGGVSWQGGKTYAIGAGDCIVYPASAAPHTVIAGDDGMDVLAFGTGSDSSLTWLPRAKGWWAGPHWIPGDGPNPFRLEAGAGPLELPEPEAERPPNIAGRGDVEPEVTQKGPTDVVELVLGKAAGSKKSGLNELEIKPGARSWPHHVHSAEEELFYVLAGSGIVRLGEDRLPVRAGHVLARPPGSRVAHSFVAGVEGLTLLTWGTREPNDIVWFPDSQKVYWRGIGVMARVEPASYWDGET